MRYWCKVLGDDVRLVRTILMTYKLSKPLMDVAFHQSNVRALQRIEMRSSELQFDMYAQHNPFNELMEVVYHFNVSLVVMWDYGMAIFDDLGVRQAELNQEEIDSLDKHTDQYLVQIANMLQDKLYGGKV